MVVICLANKEASRNFAHISRVVFSWWWCSSLGLRPPLRMDDELQQQEVLIISSPKRFCESCSDFSRNRCKVQWILSSIIHSLGKGPSSALLLGPHNREQRSKEKPYDEDEHVVGPTTRGGAYTVSPEGVKFPVSGTGHKEANRNTHPLKTLCIRHDFHDDIRSIQGSLRRLFDIHCTSVKHRISQSGVLNFEVVPGALSCGSAHTAQQWFKAAVAKYSRLECIVARSLRSVNMFSSLYWHRQ